MSRVGYLTAADVRARAKAGTVRIGAGERVTDFARDEARRLGLRWVEVEREPRVHPPSRRRPDHDVLTLDFRRDASDAVVDEAVAALIRAARTTGARLLDRREQGPGPHGEIALRFDWSGALPARREAFRRRILEWLGAADSAEGSEGARDFGESAELRPIPGVRGGFEG